MISIARIEQNIAAFVVEDMVPQMSVLEGAILATAAPFVIRAKLKKYLPALTDTEIYNGESVEIEPLYRGLKANLQNKWPVEFAGFKFCEQDLDRLYQYLQR